MGAAGSMAIPTGQGMAQPIGSQPRAPSPADQPLCSTAMVSMVLEQLDPQLLDLELPPNLELEEWGGDSNKGTAVSERDKTWSSTRQRNDVKEEEEEPSSQRRRLANSSPSAPEGSNTAQSTVPVVMSSNAPSSCCGGAAEPCGAAECGQPPEQDILATLNCGPLGSPLPSDPEKAPMPHTVTEVTEPDAVLQAQSLTPCSHPSQCMSRHSFPRHASHSHGHRWRHCRFVAM